MFQDLIILFIRISLFVKYTGCLKQVQHDNLIPSPLKGEEKKWRRTGEREGEKEEKKRGRAVEEKEEKEAAAGADI